MKKALIIGGSLLAVAIGVLIFLLSYSYSTNHYGENFELYAAPGTCTIPMTAEYKGETYLIHPYNRYEVYKTLTRGKGAIKSHMFEQTSDGDKIVVKIGDKFVFTIYEDTSVEDGVFITVDNEGKKKYYSLQKFKTFPYMLSATGVGAGNFRITGEVAESKAAECKSLAESFMKTYSENGGATAIKEYGDADLAESIAEISVLEDIRMTTGLLQKLGKFIELDDVSCYPTDSNGVDTVVIAAARVESDWQPFMLLTDAEGKIISYDFF